MAEMVMQTASYTAYGYLRAMSGAALGFNGELIDRLLLAYALGNGHRFYSPRLMRFCSEDALSPFGKGGVNAYCYCEGDPINRSDPSGRAGTGLTAQFELRKIPLKFKRSVKRYFKSNPSETSYHFGMGTKGYLIDKASDGRLTVTPILGLGDTHRELKKAQIESALLKSRNSELEKKAADLEAQVRALKEQMHLPKPMQPLRYSTTSPPLPPPPLPPKLDRPVNPTSIRQS
ncbi:MULTISPECIES: RHS repeat-associated core domain-containing protein [unclassified Pseudomonas]|uniref:RHS repeat-associated core domain-containing protein n=1 Tax=unclassified Pseudomonas TaxID=196821 RepID=UPI000A1F03E2|nr:MULTISPECIES: RHS repeat-associated core domain-containing protein [unclassified Pseudomonas]